MVKMIKLGLIVLVTGCAQSDAPQSAPPRRDLIHSSLGFSFLPPHGKDWTEEFGKSQVVYWKETDRDTVSFYAGALEVPRGCLPTQQEELAEFVRARKDEWGSGGRYTHIASSFVQEARLPSCVRYQMTAKDYGAKNRGSNPFMTLQVVGRFCTHPQKRDNAVDLFYSVRHVPGYDARTLTSAGEAFLDSLAADPLPEAPPARSSPDGSNHCGALAPADGV